MKNLSWKFIALLALTGTNFAPAATVTWVGDRNNTGVNSMDWFDAGVGDTQWSTNLLPGTGDTVVMDNTGTYPDTATGSGNGSVSITMNSGVTMTKWEFDKIFQGIGLVAGAGGAPAHQANDINFNGSGPITFDGPGTVLEVVEWYPAVGAESIIINPQINMPSTGVYEVLRRNTSELSNDILFLDGQFTGSGTVELNNQSLGAAQRIDLNNSSNSYTGGTILSGFIGYNSVDAFSSGSIQMGANLDTLVENRGGAANLDNAIELNSTPGRNITLINRNGNTLTISGGISGGETTGNLILRPANGSGFIDLTGTNTFASQLEIQGPGDVVLSGSLAHSNITVTSNGTLSSDGGTLTLNIDDDTADMIDVSGVLDLSNMNLIVNLTGTQTSDQYTFLSGSGTIAAEFTNISVNSSGLDYEASVLDLGGGTFALQLSEIAAPVPEPSSLLLFSMGAMFLGFRRKNRS